MARSAWWWRNPSGGMPFVILMAMIALLWRVPAIAQGRRGAREEMSGGADGLGALHGRAEEWGFSGPSQRSAAKRCRFPRCFQRTLLQDSLQ